MRHPEDLTELIRRLQLVSGSEQPLATEQVAVQTEDDTIYLESIKSLGRPVTNSVLERAFPE